MCMNLEQKIYVQMCALFTLYIQDVVYKPAYRMCVCTLHKLWHSQPPEFLLATSLFLFLNLWFRLLFRFCNENVLFLLIKCMPL